MNNRPPIENNHRAFIRHTVDVPLEVSAIPSSNMHERAVSIGSGGLAFTSNECLEEGQIIHLRIPTVNPPFEAQARVVWCRPEDGKYLMGVQFLDPKAAFQSRMVQQVCSIEQYRAQVKAEEGRELTSQDAAAEWIQKYAGRFPDASTIDDVDG